MRVMGRGSGQWQQERTGCGCGEIIARVLALRRTSSLCVSHENSPDYGSAHGAASEPTTRARMTEVGGARVGDGCGECIARELPRLQIYLRRGSGANYEGENDEDGRGESGKWMRGDYRTRPGAAAYVLIVCIARELPGLRIYPWHGFSDNYEGENDEDWRGESGNWVRGDYRTRPGAAAYVLVVCIARELPGLRTYLRRGFGNNYEDGDDRRRV
ncbi:hypothetical protein FRC11_003322 [Ceratobasidium sp. 423]|nr:hypothetical protein FRC11_003322 [Ceratobasidium sp. 423]